MYSNFAITILDQNLTYYVLHALTLLVRMFYKFQDPQAQIHQNASLIRVRFPLFLKSQLCWLFSLQTPFSLFFFCHKSCKSQIKSLVVNFD